MSSYLLLVTLISCSFVHRFHCARDFPGVTFLDVNNLLSSGYNSSIIINVRDDAELNNAGRIPGFKHIALRHLKSALSLPGEEFAAKYGFDLPGKNTSLAFSCRSGRRATAAAETAIELGCTKKFQMVRGVGKSVAQWNPLNVDEQIPLSYEVKV